MSSLAFLPIKAVDILVMGVCRCTALELSKMQNQKWLTLHGNALFGGGSDIDAGLCAHEGSQYCDYGLMLSPSPVNILDAGPEIGDALLMLISRMGQRACRLPFYI